MGRNRNLYVVMMDGKGRNTETRRLNAIILIEEMDQLYRNCFLLMSNVRCDISTYLRGLLFEMASCIGYVCTSELVLKQHVLLSWFFHMRATPSMIRRKNFPLSAISPNTPNPSCIPTSRNQGVSCRAKGVATHADLHDQSKDLHSTISSTVCTLKGWWGTKGQKANGNRFSR
jgi:hypothetical protein